jgi:hypothetical protein
VTTIAEGLVRDLGEMGVRITVENGVSTVSRPADPRHHKRFQALLQGLKQYREEVLAFLQGKRLELCPLCRRDVSDPEDRERLAGVNPFCTRGFMPARWKAGVMIEKKADGCPYRRM